jgi:hypothetical protein
LTHLRCVKLPDPQHLCCSLLLHNDLCISEKREVVRLKTSNKVQFFLRFVCHPEAKALKWA